VGNEPATIRVTRRFTAPSERVFDGWLDPELLGQWMFGAALPEDEVVRLTVDAKVGGRFSFLVRRQGQELDHVGTYQEIDRPRRLAFTWGIVGHSEGDYSVVTIGISPLASGCELTLTHAMDPKWAPYAERTQTGWTKMVEALAKMLEQM
jgi:uncharacterized protein YndB with AHSA1/START domain